MTTALCWMPLFLVAHLANAQFTYPLQIGNRWQYKEPPPPESSSVSEDRVVGDTVMPNGRSYGAITIGGVQFCYFRQEGEIVYEYYRNREIVRFDWSKNGNFNLGIHDTVTSFLAAPSDTVIITVLDTGHVILFGDMRSYKTFYWQEGASGTTFYRLNVVVDSIGISFTEVEAGAQWYLAGAVLNGVTYGTVTSANEQASARSVGYALLQNYPNPFNPTTTIRYMLPRRSHVTLSIYNMLGQRVATVAEGEVEAGYHDVRFDGSGLPSAVYFYRLSAGRYTQTKTCILCR